MANLAGGLGVPAARMFVRPLVGHNAGVASSHLATSPLVDNARCEIAVCPTVGTQLLNDWGWAEGGGLVGVGGWKGLHSTKTQHVCEQCFAVAGVSFLNSICI